MRDDEDIGHYLPLLRRIIILVAVITAIPVVLWTITAFVRAYVGPPKMPTFHQLASKASINEPASTGSNQESTDRMMAAAAQQAKLADPSSTATDKRGDAAAPKGPLLTEHASDAPMNALPSSPPPPSPLQPSPLQPSPSQSSPPPQPLSTPVATMSPASVPTSVAMQPQASTPAASAVKPDDPWPPMPASANVPNQQEANERIDAAKQPAVPPAAQATADELPAAAPLAGPIPLPKRRPRVLAEAQAEPTPPAGEPATRTEAPTRMASAGPIPMPRPRPDDAPASTTPAESSSGPLDFITNIFGGNK